MTITKPKVLIIGASCGRPETDNELRQVAEVTVISRQNDEDTSKAIAEAVKESGPFVCMVGTFGIGEPFPMKWDEKLLGALAPECKCFAGPGAGYDKVDINWVTSQGAMYANAPTTVGERTADGAFMLLLATFRGILVQDGAIREGKFGDKTSRNVNWRKSTLGVIGMGNIGRQIADMSASMGMKVIYNNRSKKDDAPYDYVTIDELFAQSDAIVLACPLTDDTRHIINKGSFTKMKDGVIIVNVARGPCIDEGALVEALESRKVLRCALDVFEKEPEVHPGLIASPYAILSPHTMAALDISLQDINAEVLQNAINFVKTGKPLTPVNLRELKAAGVSI